MIQILVNFNKTCSLPKKEVFILEINAEVIHHMLIKKKLPGYMITIFMAVSTGSSGDFEPTNIIVDVIESFCNKFPKYSDSLLASPIMFPHALLV